MNPVPDSDEDVRQLFRKHVPEVANGTVEIVALARIPGRSLLAVRSHDSRTNPAQACAGRQGSLLKKLRTESGGEFFSVIAWHDSPEELIRGAFFVVAEVVADSATRRATVTLNEPVRKIAPRCGSPRTSEIMTRFYEDNAFLIAKITGWEIQMIFRETESD